MPMRLSKLEQWLKQHGVYIETGSRHFHARKDGFGVFPIPAHNAWKTEISNVYLRALCKHFKIDPKTLPI